MERYVDGDESAFTALHARLEGPLRRTLARWLKDAARVDDGLQVALLKIHRNRHRYRRGAAVLPWVLTIARHVALDDLRKDKNRPRSLDDELLQVLPAPEGPPWSEEDERAVIEAVRAAVDQLPPGTRDVVRMHKLEGRSMAEVAEHLGIKEGAARVRAHRGYKALAKALLGFRAQRRGG
jgi:RNA polymerase sigma-70 factor (ECF subfamily)